MKKYLGLLLASTLVLGACGNKEENKSEDKKEVKAPEKNKKKEDKKSNKQDKSKDTSNQEVATHDENTEQQTKEETSQSQENGKVDVSNITDRSILESVIYGNYTEMEKINAYNSAVANGVIPQGNVMEGPASAAYESSLKVESGEVESVYEKNSNDTNDYLDEDTAEQQREDATGGPRSFREIKEQTGKGASDFTEAEKEEANAYAREH
ncbi:hypothetical protein AABD42_09190 [Staphylococcus shinii]|uniref:hypothetical protein n=1 Tax=Staphylococcus shinii TaxID=2912228 RepID=UPI001AAFC659|nr:hypothetical protein [Staphylococcus shinii]MBO3066057.1 hypothetical protein [Staphylococcus shinii]